MNNQLTEIPVTDDEIQRVLDAFDYRTGIESHEEHIVRCALAELQERRKADSEPVATLDVQSRRPDGNKFALVFSSAAHKLPDDVYFLYRHAQPAPVESEGNHIGSKNALDSIVTFIDSKRNPTRKEFSDTTERMVNDGCYSLAQHVIKYIREIGSELIDLRGKITNQASTNSRDEPAQRLTFRLKDGREIGGIATGITAIPGVIILRDENNPYLYHGVPDNEIAQIFFFTRSSVGSTGETNNGRSNEKVQAVEVQSVPGINPAPALGSLPKRGEVLPANSPVIPEGWQVEAEKLAEMHGMSFVLFRHGEAPQCADPTKVAISFTDKGLGHDTLPAGTKGEK